MQDGQTTESKRGETAVQSSSDRAFQLAMLRLQLNHGYRVAYHAAYFGVGASFEVFALTLVLTALLLGRNIETLWWVLIALYLVTGVGFVAYGVYGFGRTRRLQDEELEALTKKYA